MGTDAMRDECTYIVGYDDACYAYHDDDDDDGDGHGDDDDER